MDFHRIDYPHSHGAPPQLMLTRGLLLGGLLLGIVLAAAFALRGAHPLRTTRLEERVLQYLKSEKVCELATDRIGIQLAVHLKDSNLLLGRREGWVIVTVTVTYGFDLAGLTAGDIAFDGQSLAVRLGEPGILGISPALSKLRFVTKASGLQIIGDHLRGRNLREELLRLIDRESARHIRDSGALPTRAEMIDRLNARIARLLREQGLTVRFH